MAKECKFSLRTLQKSIQGAFTWFFSNLGRFTGKRPWVTIAISLIFIIGFAFGFLRMNDLTESDTMKLYVPQSSRGFDGQDAYDAVFGSSTSDFYVIFQTKDSSKQLLTVKHLKEIMNFEYAIRNTKLHGTQYSDICAKIDMGPTLGENCREISPALYFGYEPGMVDYLLNGKTVEEYICKNVMIPNYYMFGSVEDLSDAACATSKGLPSAKAILITFSSLGSSNVSDQVYDWQDDVRDLIDDKLAGELKDLNVYYYWGNGVNNEVVRGITDAIPKIAISIALVIVFLILTMADFKDPTKSFSLLGVFAVLVTVCGIVLGLGFSLTVGIKWTPTSIIIAFLVLGMGVNNAVLLHSTFERQDKSLPVEEQNAAALGEASIFITLTSATTLLSFLMGMNTDFPGIRYFCGSSALVITACYILVLTLFNGIMIVDWKRSMANRMDWFCCVVKDKSEVEKIAKDRKDNENKGCFYHFLDTYVRKLYENRIFQICAVLIFLGIAGFFLYQCTTIDVGLNTEDVVPDDSHLKKQHFPTLQPNIHILLPKLDYYKKDVRARIVEMTQKIQQVPGVDKTRSTNIWEIFNALEISGIKGADVNDPVIYTMFLNGILQQVAALSEQLKMDSEGNIEVSDVLLYHTIETENGGFAVESMNNVRDIIDSYSDLKAVDYCGDYPIWDSNNAVKKETWINLMLSAVAVVIVLLCLLTPWTAIVVLVNIALIDICVVGWVPSLNLVLNSVTCCCLVLSVGVAVDYSAHIANRFMLSTGTKSQRAGNSIVVMSVNLLSGGIASILGIFMLAFANVPTNRVFFQMMIGVLMFGILYGMVNLPCMFALIGDKSINEGKESDNNNEKKKKEGLEMVEENKLKDNNSDVKSPDAGEVGCLGESAKVVPAIVVEEKEKKVAPEVVNHPNAVEDHSDNNNNNKEEETKEEVKEEIKTTEQEQQKEEPAENAENEKKEEETKENENKENEEVKVEDNEGKQQ